MRIFKLSFGVIILAAQLSHIHTLRIPRDVGSTDIAIETTIGSSSTVSTLEISSSKSESLNLTSAESLDSASPESLNSTLSAESSNSTSAENVNTPPEASGSSSKPQITSTNPQGAEALSRLFQSINSTFLQVNKIIWQTMKQASEQRTKDFERIGKLVQNAQLFLLRQKANATQDASNHFQKSIEDVQKFFNGNQKKVHQRFDQSNLSSSITDKNTIDNNSTLSADNSTIINETKSAVDSVPESSNVTVSIIDTSPGRERSGGLMENFRQMSSKMGQGFTETIRRTENVVTDSLNQIQTQIQGFVNGLNDAFANVGNAFQLPNLFNLTLPQPPTPTESQ